MVAVGTWANWAPWPCCQRDYAEARRRHTTRWPPSAPWTSRRGKPSPGTSWAGRGGRSVACAGRAAAPLWAEAEHCYRESLSSKRPPATWRGVAETANQLGIVCQRAGRPAEAETWYRRALAIDEQLGRQKEVAMRANNLASLLLDMAALPPAGRPAAFAGRDLLAEAEAFALRALEIRRHSTTHRSKSGRITRILAQIAERRGRGRRRGGGGARSRRAAWFLSASRAVGKRLQAVRGFRPKSKSGNRSLLALRRPARGTPRPRHRWNRSCSEWVKRRIGANWSR